METEGILDIGNGIHVFALQYTYAPRLEVDLQAWDNSHNNHGVRTENYKAPLQSGMLEAFKMKWEILQQCTICLDVTLMMWVLLLAIF